MYGYPRESESPAEDLRHVSQDWFITKPGTQLEDLLFVDQDRRPSKKEVFKASSHGMRAPVSQKDAKKHICRILGIGDSEASLGKKFNEVFHMGTSLKDISDIRTFIYAYILPPEGSPVPVPAAPGRGSPSLPVSDIPPPGSDFSSTGHTK